MLDLILVVILLFFIYVIFSIIAVKKSGVNYYNHLMHTKKHDYIINKEYKLVVNRVLKSKNKLEEVDIIIKEIKQYQKEEQNSMNDILISSVFRIIYGTYELGSYYGRSKYEIDMYNKLLIKIYDFKSTLKNAVELKEA